MNRELCVTTDFYDDLMFTGTLLEERHIDDMMRYATSLGASRFEWIVDTMWNLYDEGSPLGYDLLEVACDAAHRHGMRFDAVYKPFEGGLGGPKMTLPPSVPRASGGRVVENEAGVLYAVRKFVAENQQFCIARKAGDGDDPGGRLAEIRLVKFDENAIRITPEDISFWYSSRNGNFKKYKGPLETSITNEWRLGYPYADELSTVLSFKGFDLPEDVRYVEIRCARTGRDGNFSNHIENLVELINERGESIPCAPSTVNPDPQSIYTQAKRISDLGITDHLKHPEMKRLLESFETFKQHVDGNCNGMYAFVPQWEVFTLDAEGAGAIAVHRGKPRQHPAAMHPIYPEVREHWLEQVRYCIDRGVDGVNIRISRHGGMNEPWAYGFNEPVIRELQNKDDTYEAAVVNGRAFDTFMQDAASLLHRNGKEIGVHLCGLILASADKKMVPPKPCTFVWNWEKWVREIVDYTEFHKTNFFKFHNAKQIIDHFGHVVREAGKPFIYQSGQSAAVTHYQGPHRFLPFEIEWIKNHEHVTCYNLYETASLFKLGENGRYEGSPDIREMVKRCWA